MEGFDNGYPAGPAESCWLLGPPDSPREGQPTGGVTSMLNGTVEYRLSACAVSAEIGSIRVRILFWLSWEMRRGERSSASPDGLAL